MQHCKPKKNCSVAKDLHDSFRQYRDSNFSAMEEVAVL